MSIQPSIDFAAIRAAMANFDPASRIQPNETIASDRVFLPSGHRGVLDFRRQLVIGNRGMGKSFWTHALVNPDLRATLSSEYSLPALARTQTVIGFNGAETQSDTAPAISELKGMKVRTGVEAERIWQASIVRAVRHGAKIGGAEAFDVTLGAVSERPSLYAEALTAAEKNLRADGQQLLILFDALDLLPGGWDDIRGLTKALLKVVLGLESVPSIRAKVFMRVDQFGDNELFAFPDGSKLKNNKVDLGWRPEELFGLILFELHRASGSCPPLKALASQVGATKALPGSDSYEPHNLEQQECLIEALAGTYMGANKKRGRVYSWVPLHLSDAANNCSPRTFLTAWREAALHSPAPAGRAIDHLGLIEGVRKASETRLTELREEYPWIDLALEPLRGQHVPMGRSELLNIWQRQGVVDKILTQSQERFLPPVDITTDSTPAALLRTMRSIAVMEERANGKINVPDIFRVEAGLKRRGGVAVPKRT